MKIAISNFESRITSNFKYLYDNHKDFLLSYIKLNFEAVHNIDSIKIFHNSIITYDKYNELIHKSDADMADLTLDNISKAYHDHIDSLFNDINIFKQSIQNVTRENQLKAYSALIQDRFIRAKIWSQKEILVFKISYDCDRITAYYKIQNNEHIYHRYFFTKDFVEINDYIFKTKERESMILTTGNTDLGKELQSYNIVTLEKAILHYLNKKCGLIDQAAKINSISFSSLEINIKYGTQLRSYDHDINHYRFNHFRNDILDFIKNDLKSTVPIETDKSKIIIHDPKTFNSLDTLTNKNVVVIKYINEGNMSLQSMTVGCYYVAEIDTFGGNTYYKLLTRNNFSTTYKDYIKVIKSIPNVVRFEEYPIERWCDKNDFKNSDLNLYPSFKDKDNKVYDLSLLTGTTSRSCLQLMLISLNTELYDDVFKGCSYIYNKLRYSSGILDGFKTLYKNSSGKIHQYFNDNKIYVSTDINVSKFVSPGVYIDEPHRENEDERKAKEAANIKSRKILEDEEDEDEFWNDVKPKPKKRIPHPINDYKVTGWGKLPEPGDVIVAGMDIATMDRSTIITCIKPSPHQIHVMGSSVGIDPLSLTAYERQKIYDATKKESEEEQELRILRTNRPVKKHTFDESIGLTDDYLLIL